MKKNKDHISIVCIGHVDSGKSTTTGHLIYKLGGVEKRTLEKFEKEAEELGKGSYSFAWIMDKVKESRERGITIDICLQRFETKKFEVTVIDAPGHRDFIKNMITGTSSADCCLLIVDSTQGKFEAGISEEGQTKEHALLAFTLGVKQMIVGVNKMDETSVNYSEKRFNEIKSEIGKMLKKIGYNPKKIPIIPISGYCGENIVEKSEKMGWWKGGSLIDAIEKLVPPKRKTNKPLRIPIKDSYNIRGIGTVVVGRIETGVLKVGEKVVLAPSTSQKSYEVRSIEMFHKSIETAYPGDEIGINLSGISHKSVRRGMVMGHRGNTEPREVDSFVSQVIVLDHPGCLKSGYTPILDTHAAHIPCTFEKLHAKLDKRNGKLLEKNPKFLKKGEAGLIVMRPKKPLVIEVFKDFPSLGRFALRYFQFFFFLPISDMKKTIGVGVVKEVRYKDVPKN